MIDFTGDVRGIQLELLVGRAMYERWRMQEVARLLDREFGRVVDLILSPAFRSLTRFQQQRAADLFRELDRVIRASYREVTAEQLAELRRYADVEAEITHAIVTGALPDLPETVATGILSTQLTAHTVTAIATLPIQGLALGDWFEAQANTMSLETRRAIQQGLIDGKGMAEISRRVVATETAKGPVLSRRMKQEARIITRTSVAAVQNFASMGGYGQLPPTVSDSYRYVAVLDARTSTICRALDGRVYKYSDPNRREPPQHLQCRSTTIPLLKGADATLTAQRDQALSLRSYESWLRAQPATVQNDILGPTRAQWFRDGKLSLGDLIDQDNRVLTLTQLRARLGLTHAVRRAPVAAF